MNVTAEQLSLFIGRDSSWVATMFRNNKISGYIDQQSRKLEKNKAPGLILPGGSSQLNTDTMISVKRLVTSGNHDQL